MRLPFILSILLLFQCTETLSAPAGIPISGIVTEKISGEVIIGGTVIVHRDSILTGTNALQGAVTNKFGYYSIPNLPEGKYFLTIRAIGYRNRTLPLNLNDPTASPRIDVELMPQDIQGEEVIVQADRKTPTSMTSRVDLQPATVQKLPSLGGESDIFRTLQLLPGIKAVSEISSGLYVRGGSPDQNLTLLDGVIVYNPSHLFGFLSTFNADAIRDITMIKGAFPAEYGGRLSSVLDLTMREGTKEKLSGKAGISMINSRLTLEGPIGDNATFMLSGRRMYLDLLLLAVSDPDSIPRYFFYDLNGKVNYKLSENNRIYLSAYLGRDVLNGPPAEADHFEISWGNITTNFRWMHIVSPTFFTNFSAIYTDYDFSTLIQEKNEFGSVGDDNFKSVSGVQDIMLRAEGQYYPNAEHTIKAGLEVTQHRFRADASAEISEFLKIERDPTIFTSLDAALYIQDEWDITPLLSGNIGGRFYYFEGGNYVRFEPRLSLAYQLTEDISLKSAFSMGNQFLHLITRNDLTLPNDVWFPSTDNIRPSEALQIVAGVETYLFDREYFVTVEGYYKKMENLLEYKDTASFTLDVPLESSFTSGNGEAYGIELFVNKQLGSFTGWLGYTLAWTRRTFPELNEGKPFFPRYDRRHDISLVLTYKLGESWELGATWVYGTGQAYTMATGQYNFQNPAVPGSQDFDDYYYYNNRRDYTERNGFRLPAFHKLDLNFTHTFSWFQLPWALSLNIYNAYNRKNVFYQYIDTEQEFNPSTGQYVEKPVLRRVTLFPIIPTFGLSFTF